MRTNQTGISRPKFSVLDNREMPHAVTEISPAMMMFGRHLTLPADLEYGIPFFEKTQKYSGEYAVKLR